MKKSFIPLLIFSFLLVITASADYSRNNQNDNYVGPTRFTELITTVSVTDADVTNAYHQAYVRDIDGDGTKEVVVLTDDSIIVYNKDLTKEAEIDMSTNITGSMSPPFMYDYDGDGFTEIFVMDIGTVGGVDIIAIEHNGTVLNSEMKWSGNIGGGASTWEGAIYCVEDPEFYCLIISWHNNDEDVDAWMINDSAMGAAFPLLTEDGTRGLCSPNEPAIAYGDWDGSDAYTEFFMSFYHQRQSGAGQEQLAIIVLEPLYDNLTFQLENYITEDLGEDYTEVNADCQESDGMVSNVYLADIDGNAGTGLEAVVSVQVNDGKFKMYSFDKTGGFLDDYPEGGILGHESGGIDVDWTSDIFPMDVMTDTGRVEFCFQGVEDSTSLLRMVCGAEQGDFLDRESIEFVSVDALGHDMSVGFNISFTNTVNNERAMSATYGGKDDVYNAYGGWDLEIFNLCYVPLAPTECYLTRGYALDKRGATPVQGAITLDDSEQEGFADIYLLQDSILYLFDDGFENQGCLDTSCQVPRFWNPCIDLPWKLNTTVQVSVIGVDSDGDDWAGRVILYANTSNAQDSGWVGNQTSGDPLTYSFVANTTISAGKVDIMYRETGQYDQIETVRKTFSVQANGIEFNDVTCTESTVEPTSVNVTPTPPDEVPDNSVSVTVDTLKNLTGLSGTLIFLFIMFLATAAIWYFGHNTPAYALAMTVIINLLLLVMGIRLEYLTFGTLLIFIILAVAVASVAIARVFTNGSGG